MTIQEMFKDYSKIAVRDLTVKEYKMLFALMMLKSNHTKFRI